MENKKLESNTQKIEWIVGVHRIVSMDGHVTSCSDVTGSTENPKFTFKCVDDKSRLTVRVGSCKAKGRSLDLKGMSASDAAAAALGWCHDDDKEKGKKKKEDKLVEFSAFRSGTDSPIDESESVPSFSTFRGTKTGGFAYLNESENAQVDEAVERFEDMDGELEDLMDEGLLGKIVGGAAGFIIGPMIGRIIANALGIERGIFYDMLTSRLVTTALGIAISKYVGGEYKNK